MSVLFGLAAIASALVGICALCWAIGRLDDRLDRRQQTRAAARLARAQQDVIAAAELITRTAAARTEEGTP